MDTGRIECDPITISSIAALEKVAPDPTKLFVGIPDDNLPAASKLFRRQRRRRAEILLHARLQIIAGVDDLNITSIAEACGISPQTVYNLVGDRQSIFSATVDEQFSAMLNAARQLTGYSSFFAALSDVLWYSAYHNPDYMRMLNRAYFHPQSPIYESLRRRMRMSFRQAIQMTVPSEQWQDDRSPDDIAERMNALVSISTLEWAEYRLDTRDFRHRLTEDLHLLLRGLSGRSRSLELESRF